MASERQIEANRLNAQASTGPRTEEGKAQSSRNALTHGLTARALLLADEDPEEYCRLHEGFIMDLASASTLEDELVAQIASVFWRMRRVAAAEAALMAWLKAKERERDRNYSGPPVKNMTDQLWFGRTVNELLNLDFGKLSRHAAGLRRDLSALLKELRETQARRQYAAQGEKDQPSRARRPVPSFSIIT